ncbi:MAG TPA: shikimate kinase [Gammaproteobacteria bacterium]|nr:shikimate kinase [Gammaproteobacteria bacterium]HBJ90064.1 shikimate kinase [Gammaproteobacteria bacterium]HCL74013.1 shikimate kinase [Gammaproteobacteria bacterium]|tara:strand:+ start:473 stop:988 length:516 start_codon:yes stop_codon:yes gene_type:complete
MTRNISLIGMPGAGKTVVGQALAAQLGWQCIDTDRLIEKDAGASLQQLLDDRGYLALRQLEEAQVLSLSTSESVISTGGSVVYSQAGMRRLMDISTVVFLDIDLATVKRRIHNIDQRGIASAQDQSLDMIFEERFPLYRKYAQISLPNAEASAEQAVFEILRQLAVGDPKS